MDATKGFLIGGGVVALGVGGWIAYRSYVRSETRKVLVNEYRLDKALKSIQDLENATGLDFNIPPLDALVDALVPIWSNVHPTDALDDVFVKGRESAYWPREYRRPASKKYEKMIFAALKGAKDVPDDASLTETIVGAGLNILKTLQS